MRSHGVTDYPDSGQVQASPGSDLDLSNPTYRAARITGRMPLTGEAMPVTPCMLPG